jgi:hypothetical protein
MYKLHRARDSVQVTVTAFAKFLDSLPEDYLTQIQLCELKTRLDIATDCLEKFYIKHELVLDAIVGDSTEETEKLIEAEENKKIEFENLYYSTLAHARFVLDQNTPRAPCIPVSPVPIVASTDQIHLKQVQLPKINMPMFSGVHDGWLEFRDKYESLIHKNESIGDMQRYHYLRSCLSGEASAVIQGVEFSAENYSEAWKLLCARYNNTRVLMHNHFKALFQIDAIQRESAGKLRALLDNFSKHTSALERLKGPEDDLYAALIIFIVSFKLDASTAREWEEAQDTKGLPTIDKLTKFLAFKANVLSTLELKQQPAHPSNANKLAPRPHTSKYKTVAHVANNPPLFQCVLCKNEHYLRNCPRFLKLSVSQRLEKIKALNRCSNCLRFGHSSSNCTSSNCRKCGRKHHTTLHIDSHNVSPAVTTQAEPEEIFASDATESASAFPITNTLLSSDLNSAPCVILSTAMVNIIDNNGRGHTVRALLDGGSQSNFITQRLADKLKLAITPCNLIVAGISRHISSARFSCHASIVSIHTKFNLNTNFYVLPAITGPIPSVRIDTSSINIPANISLADPAYAAPGPIDLLIGAEHFLSLLCIGQISLGNRKPVLQKSKFGWIISGTAASAPIHHTYCNVSHEILNNTLTRFWETEELTLDTTPAWSSNPCELHFKQSVAQTLDGRYVVSMPLQNINELGDSREIALKRFANLERTLNRNPSVRVQYHAFMNEYLSLGHMSLSKDSSEPEYYLPHHAVIKDSSSTTKLRVVFDATAKPLNGKSLNDCQMIGPIIQSSLFSILLRFRQHSYVVCADVEKMYRQILIVPSQRRLQKIFWRFSENEPIQSYELNTVTYGMRSASFLAIRCLFEIANSLDQSNPQVAQLIRCDMYVDDLLSGAESLQELTRIIKDLNSAFKQGCFHLRKWISNHPEIISSLDANDGEHYVDFAALDDTPSSTLGLLWSSRSDHLRFKINIDNHIPSTKRSVLSTISKIFDPLGFLSPCTIRAKMLMQTIWSEHIGWDESLPSSMHQEWLNYYRSLNVLNELRIPRHVLRVNRDTIQLHGFSDASAKAYGAVIYLVCTDSNGQTASSLLCSKSKVAPLKTVTVPRLELCAAHLLAKLYVSVSEALNVPIFSSTLWSDSTITLAWIRQCPSILRTFVANRVSQISGMTMNCEWRHVPTNYNPADLVSRGVDPAALLTSDLWWHGPPWLCSPKDTWPSLMPSSSPDGITVDCQSEMRPLPVVSLTINIPAPLLNIHTYSSFNKLQRVTAYILRFIYNLQQSAAHRRKGFLTYTERENAVLFLVKSEQQSAFLADIQTLSKGIPLSSRSNILSLAPFIDDNGILRVGGRLKHANISYNEKHPILLPRSSAFVKLLFVYEHKRLLHIGPLGLLNSIRTKYWPISGRHIARQVVRECIVCFRAQPRTYFPEMGNLPSTRITPMPPFLRCGVDYAGPYILKTIQGRGCKTYKAYIAVFVCMSSKAIHLELVTELTTQAFIATLRRFTARRGKPEIMYSDNGTNFVGSNRELRDLYDFLKNYSNDVALCSDAEGISWHFIPARSPHFGGLWEAGVKSIKYHLRRVIGEQLMTYEDFSTLLAQVEAILNSRPLTCLSSDPNDFHALTPAHLLIGRSLIALPEKDNTNAPVSSLSRYQRIQAMTNQFWKRWTRDYLNTLQQRSKWRKSINPERFQAGQVVLLIDENLPRLQWKLGRIVTAHPGDDGVIRTVSVKTSNGVVKRAVHRLCPLPVEDSPSKELTEN